MAYANDPTDLLDLENKSARSYAALPPNDPANAAVAAAMEQADATPNLNGAFATPVAPTSEQLRAGQNPKQLIDGAIDRHLEVLSRAIATGVDPRTPALYITPQQHAKLVDEHATLTNEAHQRAMADAELANLNFRQAQSTRSAREFSNIATGLSKIGAPLGSPEHAKAVLDLAAANPVGAQSDEGQKLLTAYAATHDKTARMTPEVKSYWDRFSTGFNEASQFGRSVGVDVQYDDQGFPSVEKTREYAEKKGIFVKPKAPGVADAGALRQFSKKVVGLGLTPYDFENPEQWQTREDGKVFRKSEAIGKEGGKAITLDEDTYKKLQEEHDSIYGAKDSSAPPPTAVATQFDDEAAARAAGHKPGEVVMLKNPATGKYQRARLD